jgi:hypothetical protein
MSSSSSAQQSSSSCHIDDVPTIKSNNIIEQKKEATPFGHIPFD